ncbi:DHS-like NAD/FAD-binding domain-containing protein [Leucosporidium creatinivorum]|uniref:NAD-dependent protein deacetylase n=1 Tax=Leucosporidium creatinivorum TaxID=106004 RepID=A0A1Y2G3Y7_9BASI|nr:DHS-like NAD/FAD-binding domain-containing protein [Leucosporidium creatinivorum]
MASSNAAAAQVTKQTFPGVKHGEQPGLEDVAGLIKAGQAKRVIVMAGAGISTSAGIPDFRSPETGLYANLEKYSLPFPEAIFDIDYFVEQPEAFYALAKELYPGNFKPTPTHYFFRLLHEKKVLKSVFTQNIDTLERIAGLDEELIIEAHGSFAEAECLECKKVYTKESIKPQIERGEVVYCTEPYCQGNDGALVKPKIVFFGEGLPKQFFDRISDFSTCDLLIVLGTSLSVQPFASLVHRVPSTCPRLLLNLESVGEVETARTRFFSSASEAEGFDFDGVTKRKEGIRDVRFLGSTDEGVRKLCRELGWEEELDELMERQNKLLDEERRKEKEIKAEKGDEASSAKVEKVEEEVKPEEKQQEVIKAVVDKVEEDKSVDKSVDKLAEGVDRVKLDGAEGEAEAAPSSPPKATL